MEISFSSFLIKAKPFHEDKTNIKYALSRARKLCLQFTAPHYIDLHSFYTEFNLQLKKSLPRITTKLRQSADYRELKKCITDGIKIIEKIVISQTASKRFERAKGISIYYPHGPIHITYVTTDFAQNCKWIEFLKTVLGKKVV